MNGEPSSERDRLLDLYVDGLLDGPRRKSFDRQVAQDPTLRAEIDTQTMIDESLKRLYPAPAADRAIAILEGRASDAAPASKQMTRSGKGSRGFVLAAALVMGAVGIWRMVSFLNPEPPPGAERYRWRDLRTTYYDEIEAGFNPQWTCDTDEEFASTFRGRFQQALLLAQTPSDVSPIGLAYGHSLSEQTVYLLARVRGEPVIAFVDTAQNDKATHLPSSERLSLFQRDVGRLTIYELSPLDRPFLLELFYDPDAPR